MLSIGKEARSGDSGMRYDRYMTLPAIRSSSTILSSRLKKRNRLGSNISIPAVISSQAGRSKVKKLKNGYVFYLNVLEGVLNSENELFNPKDEKTTLTRDLVQLTYTVSATAVWELEVIRRREWSRRGTRSTTHIGFGFGTEQGEDSYGSRSDTTVKCGPMNIRRGEGAWGQDLRASRMYLDGFVVVPSEKVNQVPFCLSLTVLFFITHIAPTVEIFENQDIVCGLTWRCSSPWQAVMPSER